LLRHAFAEVIRLSRVWELGVRIHPTQAILKIAAQTLDRSCSFGLSALEIRISGADP
jgi:hypothetical protein